MTASNQQNLFGFSLADGRFIPSRAEPTLFFRDQNTGSSFAIDRPSVFKNILLLGGPGSGKTNVVNQIAAQVLRWNRSGQRDGVSLIFDTKGDYLSHPGFYQRGDYIIGNDRQHRTRSVSWNIFDEVLADGPTPVDYESNAREMAGILFKDRGSKSQPFFANAARDIFASVLIFFIRRSQARPDRWRDRLNNRQLADFLLSATPQKFTTIFSAYEDMRGLLSYLGDGKNNQALGVLGELRSMIYDCFQGIFCQTPSPEHPSFSIRTAIREKGGHSIFILYDLALGESITPIYRLLVDLALKESLSTFSNGHTHIFLDELKLLPKITHLEDALNFGRSKQVSVVAGLQSVDQIYSTYGKEAGQVILSGFGSVLALKTGDYASREYISHLFGPNVSSYRYYSTDNRPVDRERDGFAVEHWDLQQLEPGHAVVGLASQSAPFLFYFEEDPDLR